MVRLIALALVVAAPFALSAQDSKIKKTDLLEIRFHDETSLKLLILDELVEVETPYGALKIPMKDVKQIEFGLRHSADELKNLQDALDDLAKNDAKKGPEAVKTLLGLREKAYAGLLKATRSEDKEFVRRVEEVLMKMRETVEEERLAAPLHDTVQTDEMRVSGKILTAHLKVKTSQFGEQSLKVADIRWIRVSNLNAEEFDPALVLPDPGNLGGVRSNPGTVLYYRVTGGSAGAGGVYGTNVYTIDSNLAGASVHAGALKSGQVGVVRVTLMGPLPNFTASNQNGITSSGYGAYPGYRVSKIGSK